MKKPEVLIVGAGPVGLTLAIECARHGVPLRIIDHNATHSTQSKALAIWSGTLECFAAMGVVEAFLKVGLPIKNFIFADHGKILNTIPCHRGIDSTYPSPIVLPQSHTEEILEQHLMSLGVCVERSVSLTSFSQDQDKVTAILLKADGSQENVEAAFLAGCDGARSSVRHTLALPFEGETEVQGFVLIDAKVEGPLPEEAMFTSWGTDYTVIFFPVKKGVFRMFTQRKDVSDHSMPTLEEMQGYLEKAGVGHFRLYDPEWLSYFGVNERVASGNYVDRVFLLGDACHIHSPAGGQGMNTGIQDAFNLGWKLKCMTQGMGDRAMIAESYFEERYPVAKTLVEETTKLLHAGINNTIVSRLTKDVLVGIFLHIPLLQHLLSEKLSEMSIHYPQSNLIEHDALSVDQRKYQAGWRSYNASVLDAETREEVSLWEKFLHTGHTLVLFSGAHLSDEKRFMLEEIVKKATILKLAPTPLIVWHEACVRSQSSASYFLDPEGRAHEHFGMTSPSWLLVRPDLYVAARGFIEEPERLWNYCQKLETM